MLAIRQQVAALIAGCAMAAGALGPAGAAQAQTPLDGSGYAFPVPDYVGALVGVNTLGPVPDGGQDGKPDAGDRPPPRRERATRRQLRTLRYDPAATVTQGVYDRVIEQVGDGVDPAVLTAQLDAARTEFRDVLSLLGWSAGDLGDMAAFSVLQCYVTWHQDGEVPRAGAKALRRQVRTNLALQKAVRRMPDARQQEIAEILELRVIFFLDARNDALVLGDSAGVAVARAEMREWAEAIFGVDVEELKLTRRGLVER